MKRIILLVVFLLLSISCSFGPIAALNPTITPTSTATATSTNTPTPTLTPTVTPTITPSPTVTSTPTPTMTATPVGFYANENLQFSLMNALGWVVLDEKPSQVQMINQDTGFLFIAQTVDTITKQENQLDLLLNLAQNNFRDPQLKMFTNSTVGARTSITLNDGTKARQQVLTGTNSTMGKITMHLIAAASETRGYLFIIFGQTQSMTDNKKILEEFKAGIRVTPQGSAAVSDTIKIAILAPLSGSVPTFGASTRDGFLLAVKEWNAKGGVLGKKIETVVADSQCSADPAVNAANKVIQRDKVHYIVGEVCSSASIPVSVIAEKYKVVMISPTSTNTNVTINQDGSTKQYVFRACFIDPFQGLVMAKFAMGKGYKTAFVMFDQGNDYVRGLAEAFEKAFTAAGGSILGKETYTKTDTDFSAILTKVAAAKPDVLYLPDYYNIVNLVGAQAKEKGVTAVMMGGDGWDSADLDVKAADGGFYSNHYDPGDTRPIVQSWIADYEKEYNTTKPPDILATLAYDSTNLLIAAIEKAGVDDPTKVAEALASIKFNAVTGTVTFDAQHNPIKDAIVIAVRGGKKTFEESIAP